MTREEYIHKVLIRLRRLTGEEQEAVRQELADHMEDHVCDLLDLGWDAEAAEERTLELMGDPAEVGEALNRQYPRLWLILSRAAIAVTAALCVTAILSIGMLGFFWNSLTYRLWAPEIRSSLAVECSRKVDIRVNIGNDVLRVCRVSLGRRDGEYLAEAALCAYDRIPGGIVSARIFGNLTAESQRGERLEYGDGRFGGGNGSWMAMTNTHRAPVRPGDDYMVLRYERFGETVRIAVPLPEWGASS